jgi:hypothetical protein
MDRKNIYTRSILRASGQEIDETLLKKMKLTWWFNVRLKVDGGLRLTDEGLRFITEEAGIKTYAVELPSKLKMTSQILIWLDNFINSPYYLSTKEIIVTEEKTAFELYLFSGDIQKLGYTKAMRKRLTQN